MKTLLVMGVLATSSVAFADGDAFVQGLVGYASPIAGGTYMEGLHDTDASRRIGVRAGWSPIHVDHMRIGVDGGVDWRPLTLEYDGDTTQEVRLLAGPRISFVADSFAVFFRTAVGYDHMYLSDYTDESGYAIEPGFGASYRYQSLLFGGEVAVPVTMHSGMDDNGFVGADFQLLLSVGAEL
jgi:hypothetical protein